MGNTYHGLKIYSCYPSLNDNIITLITLFVLLYADDTIVLAENNHQLQTALDTVHNYCTMYKRSMQSPILITY